MASEKPYIDSFELDPLYMRKAMRVNRGNRWLLAHPQWSLVFGEKADRKTLVTFGVVKFGKRRHKFSLSPNVHYKDRWKIPMHRFGWPYPPQINLPLLFPKLYLARMGRKRR